MLLLANTLFAAPELEMFERFSKSDGGPDTRGAIWYDSDNKNIFVADHGKGLWKIDECGNNHGQTTEKDKGLWDFWPYKDKFIGIGKDAMYIYDKKGNLLNTFSSVSGEGIYVQNDYAYIVNKSSGHSAKGGITIVNIKNTSKPVIVDTIMKGKMFSQVRGTDIGGDGKSKSNGKLLYVSTLDGELYLFEDDKKGTLSYKDDVMLFSGKEARKLFVSKEGLVYVNSNHGELSIVEIDTKKSSMSIKDTWSSRENHGRGSAKPTAGGVFVTEVDKKLFALITAADGNDDGYLYWLDVTNPTNITHVDTLHDSKEDYGFNNIWLNDTKIYLAAHDGFTFMGMTGIRNEPVISIKDSDDTYKEDITVMQNATSTTDTKIFYAIVENKHASEKLQAKLKAPASDSKWEYKYFDVEKDKEITVQVTKNEGYELGELAAGKSKEIKIEITPKTEDASDTTIKIVASNKDSKDICGKAIDSDEVSAKVTFEGSDSDTFTCSSNSYMFTSTAQNKPTYSYNINIVTGQSILEKRAFHTSNINAIGYNIKDNYIWGYDRENKKVVRVDANYNVTSYDIKGLPAKGFIVGDVSMNGILYLYDRNKMIYRVDVNPSSKNYLKKIKDLKISKKLRIADMAFNPIDNNIYTVAENDAHLYRIDITDGIVKDLESTKLATSTSYGASYFDKNGNYYVYNNNKGKIYKIDISNPSDINPVATFVEDAPPYTAADGARCPNADVPTIPENPFNAWDTDESISKQVIKTKIAGKSVTLTIGSLDETASAFAVHDVTDVKVSLFSGDTHLMKFWTDIVLEIETQMDVTFDVNDMVHSNYVYKDVHVRIQYEDADGVVQTVNSTNHFAIRPKQFNLSVVGYDPVDGIEAGNQFSFAIDTVSASDDIVANYHEDKNVYNVGSHEIKSGCGGGVAVVTKEDFHSGRIVDMNATYNDVGEVDFTIGEDSSSEFAAIDAGDTSDEMRQVSIGSVSGISFVAGSFDITWDFEDYNVIGPTFYSNDLTQMSALLRVTVVAEDGSGNPLLSYRAGCYSKDGTVSFDFDVHGSAGQTMSANAEGESGTPILPEPTFTIDSSGVKTGVNLSLPMDADRFHNGENSENIQVNFERSSQSQLEPAKMQVTKVFALDDDGYGESLSASTNNEATFYYARSHAADQSFVGKKATAVVDYEVFCRSCNKPDFALNMGRESRDSVFWYVIPNSIATDFTLSSPPTSTPGINVVKELGSSDKIAMTVDKTPHLNMIKYVSPSYLMFDQFKAIALEHTFKVKFIGGTAQWAGQGELGKTTDMNVAKESGSMGKKLDW